MATRGPRAPRAAGAGGRAAPRAADRPAARAGPIASPQGYHAALNDYADKVVNPLPNARVYYVDEFHHVYLGEPLNAKLSLGVSLSTFLTQQIADDPAWASVRP